MAYAANPIDAAADVERLHAGLIRWRRRSHLIRFFRLALPLTMAVMLLGLLGWVVYRAVVNRTDPVAAENVSVRMLNPRFRGRDDEGRPFVLSATEAARDSRNFQRVLLTNPSLVLETGADKPLRVRAREGVYNERTFVMDLQGAVHVDHPSGWVFDTEKAVVETTRSVISGDSPVQGVGPMGRIAGSSYVVYNEGDRVIIRGQVRSTLTR